MEIPLNTENFNRTFNHGTVTVERDDVERRISVDAGLSVGGSMEQTPDEVARQFANDLEDLIQKYAI